MKTIWYRILFFLFKSFLKGVNNELSKKDQPPQGPESVQEDRDGDTKG